MNRINSDALGEKGEQRFAELCADASLICNKSSRDRAGWDYIVEFPLDDHPGNPPLDQRPQPPECTAQVKTVWAGQRRIRLRLSSAARLARLLRPTSIFVLTVRSDLAFDGLYALHVYGELLSKILERIRSCEKEGKTRLNREVIDISFLEFGTKLEVSGAALAEFITRMNAGDIASYIARKDTQIKNLGATGIRYTGTLSLRVKSEEELADVMLGLKRGKITQFSANEIRWGIEMPLAGPSDTGEIEFKPKPHKGELLVRSCHSRETVIVPVGIAMSGPIGLNSYAKARIYNEYLEFHVAASADSYSFSFETSMEPTRRLSQYLIVNKVVRLITEGGGRLQISANRKRLLSATLREEPMADEHAVAEYAYRTLRNLKSICEDAGGGDPLISAEMINGQGFAIDFMHSLLNYPEIERTASFRLEPDNHFPPELTEADTLMISGVKFQDKGLAFCATAHANIVHEKEYKMFSLTHFRARDIRLVDLTDGAWRDFEEDMRAETGIDLTLWIPGSIMNAASKSAEDATGGTISLDTQD